MRKETPFKIPDAINYIEDSIKYWIAASESDKISSLANFAYNRRNKSTTISVAANLKDSNKSIKGLEQIIKRDKHRGKDTSVLEEQLANMKVERDKLQEQLAKEPAKTPRIRRQSPLKRTRLKRKPPLFPKE
jgi:hypothetical protein